MKKVFPLVIILAILGCNTSQENNSTVSTFTDSVTIKTVQKVTQPKSNIIDVYQFLKAQTIMLGEEQTFEFPEIKEENGKYNVYDPAFDEPVTEAILSSYKEKMDFTFGDYNVSVFKIAPCSKENYVSIVVSNLMGNYSNYTLQVFKVDSDNKLSNVTSEVLNFNELNKKFIDLKNVSGLTISDYQFSLKEDGNLNVKLNESKLNPVYLNDNEKASIGKTSEEQRKQELTINWSSSECGYIITK